MADLNHLFLTELWELENLAQANKTRLGGTTTELEALSKDIRNHPQYNIERHREFYQKRLLGPNEFPCGGCVYSSFAMAEMITDRELSLAQGLKHLPEIYVERFLEQVESFAQTGTPKGSVHCMRGRAREFDGEGWLCPDTKMIPEYETKLTLTRDVARRRLRELGGIPWKLR